mgnify:CR=1 FL=1|tara:strand:+ start:125 stop:1360 length:1236 start_codon:yes stop_codon:yes gene_type:complete
MELEAVKKLNSELKEQGYKFSLEIYRASYYARGTFKLSDGTTKRKRINLDIPADITRLSEANKRITQLQLVIDQSKFLPDKLPWAADFKAQSNQILVKDAIKKYKEYWWKNKKTFPDWWIIEDDEGVPDKKAIKERAAKATAQELLDRRSWGSITPYLNRLEKIAESPLTVNSLYRIAETNYPAQTRGRKQVVQVFKKIIELCREYDIGGHEADLNDLRATKYVAKSKVNYQDEEFLRIIRDLRELMPEWGWAFGMLYCFGMRPSEVFGASVNPTFTANVLGLKGESGIKPRTAFTQVKSVVEEFNLMEIDRPYTYNNLDEGEVGYLKYDAIKCKQWTDSWGKKLRRVIKENKIKPFVLYDLRHNYARRTIKGKIPTANAAMSMGHSVTLFQKVYLSTVQRQDIEDIQASL